MKKLTGENLMILSLFLLVALLFMTMKISAEITGCPVNEQIKTAITTDDISKPDIVENPFNENSESYSEDFENEKIEAALYESGYFRSDIPLDGDTQAMLRAACEESRVPYELALAVIWEETRFENIVGDSGKSVGYMQIQEHWHRERMEALRATNLLNPSDNFRVGCNYLSELLSKYSLEEALTAYNSGTPGESQYANDVIDKMNEFT